MAKNNYLIYGKFIAKQIFLILSITFAVLIALKIQEANLLAIYFSEIYIIPSIYLLFILSTKLKYLKSLNYNYKYLFLSSLIFTISPSIEVYLSNSMALFFGEIFRGGEAVDAFGLLLIFILLIIKFLIIIYLLAWIFKRFEKNGKRKNE